MATYLQDFYEVVVDTHCLHCEIGPVEFVDSLLGNMNFHLDAVNSNSASILSAVILHTRAVTQQFMLHVGQLISAIVTTFFLIEIWMHI